MAPPVEARGDDPTLTWSSRGADIQAIEGALARLRRQAAEAAEEEVFAIRTSVLNLVAYATDEQSARRAEAVIASLPSHHPSRSLIVLALPDAAEAGIDARLAAHCHLAGWVQQAGSAVRRQVCCEEVSLTVRGQAARHLHSVIIPLLVSDLPVFVWWTGDLPRDEHLLGEMLDTADRFIVDTARFARPRKALPRLAALCRRRRDCAFGDLNWGRLAPWRELLALLVERPGVGALLGRIFRVEVRCAGGGFPIQGLLLAGWLASRLRWRPRALSGDGRRHTVTLSRGRRPLRVELVAEAAAAEPGALLALRLEAEGGRAGQRLSIARAGPGKAALEVHTGETSFQEEAPLPLPGEGDLLSRELQVAGHDRAYEETLSAAVRMLGVSDRP